MVLAHLVALVGCYQPEVKDCTVQCSAPTDCAGDQVCADGWCARANVKECPRGSDSASDLTPDAAALTADATDLCGQGCTNGTCVDGVCVIDCSTPYSCPDDVSCEPNLPCRVVCGERACGHKVLCGLATSCEVQCSGDYSCADEIICNTARCDVDCIGVSSCKRRTKCSNACACDVACLGAGSCPEPSECPSSSCKLGDGCTALVAGCDTCP